MKLSKEQVESAINARINGEWDNPNLVLVGPLSTNLQEDLDYIKSLEK